MTERFEGKCAIVTGAAGGIGQAIAARVAAEGAAVVIADLRKDAAEEAAHRIGEQAIGIACDVSRETDVEACAAAAVAKFGSLDVTITVLG